VSPLSGRVVAGSVSRVATSMPISLRWLRPRRDLPRHRCPGWAAPLSQTTFAQLPGHPSFGHTCRRSTTGLSNPSEFLQVYITAITAAGANDAVMASYFHVALTGPARTWLMNLSPGSIRSWGELCAQFTANLASAYQQHGVEAHLHAVR
jgi:hypothetical protein